MLIPSCILLWHGLAVVLEPVAAKEWKAAASIANRHGVDINHPPPQVKVVPDERNFLGHPYLKEIIYKTPRGADAELQALFKVINPLLPKIVVGEDRGESVDFLQVLETLDAEFPALLEKAPPAKTPAGKVLAFLEQTGIPWDSLSEAVSRPSAQFPPVGSTAPLDEFIAPRNAQIIPSHFVGFMRIAWLYTLAALESGQTDKARACLHIQMRIVDGFMEDGTQINMVLGNGFLTRIQGLFREGLVRKCWHPADLDWMTGWLCRLSPNEKLRASFKFEIWFGFNAIDFTVVSPTMWDQWFVACRNTLGTSAIGTFGSPFGQDWLALFRGNSELFYRIAPPAAFKLWKTHEVRSIHKKYLDPLDKGGLLALAFPDKPDPTQGTLLQIEGVALNFLKNQARQNLFLTSCALAHWQARHMDLPEDLAALPPMQVEDYTRDPFSSTPLKYERHSPTSYRLYSVGADFVDDGGKPITDEGGDICWHLP
jgi:hypothetical protein